MSQRAQVEVGDVIELNVRFKVQAVHRFPAQPGQAAFTAFEYAAGEPRENGGVSVFTFEVPDEFGRIVILRTAMMPAQEAGQ